MKSRLAHRSSVDRQIFKLIIKIKISSIVMIGLKHSYFFFPLIHLSSVIGQFVIGQLVIGQFNKPITFKVVV